MNPAPTEPGASGAGREPDHPAPRILLVDCDQFFVQCARIADPSGAGREELLLVGGSASGRGVVMSASYATRAFGVRSGMPTAQALRLCPSATVVPVPRAVCLARSRDVRRVLDQFSPVVEPASIDEAFIDMGGTEALYRGERLGDTAWRILKQVLEQAGIRVSIGGGTSRLVAKLAAGRAKPNGVLVVEPGGEEAFLLGFDLADIPGVGPVFARTLERCGLVSVRDALACDPGALETWLGPARAAWLQRITRGRDGGRVQPYRAAKSVSREETFPEDLSDDASLETALLGLVVRLGADLRGQGLRARTVTVKLRDADFRTRQASRTLDDGVASDRALFALTRGLLARLRGRRRTAARLLGVAASNFRPADAQTSLFGAALETDRDREISRVTDVLRHRFGPHAVRPGRLLDSE